VTTKGYTFLGWVVWQLGSRLMKRQLAEHRVKLGAAGAVALVLVAGVAAARSGD
jgi:hypothetical protein